MTRSLRRAICLLARASGLLALLFLMGSTSQATSPNYLDVCATGCTYSKVQDAVDAITTSSATNVYTIFIDSGIVSNDDKSIITNGKSYINFVGRGEGVSIVQAPAGWFTNADSGSTHTDFFDLSSSSHITIRALTIDARANAPTGSGHAGYGGVRVDNSDSILVDGADIQGLNYGLWQNAGTAGNMIEVFHSKILSSSTTIVAQYATWHIYSSEVKSLQTDTVFGGNDTVVALDLVNDQHLTIWGSHVHAESSKAGAVGLVAAMRANLTASGEVDVIGTQLHLKIGTTNIGTSSKPMYAFYASSHYNSFAIQFNFVGSYLNYESPASISQGVIGGIGYNKTNSGQTVNFVGGGIFDVGGSGGSYRADVIQNGGLGSAPVFNVAGSKIGAAVSASGALPSGLGSGYATLNTQRGGVTLSGGTASVTLPTALPDSSYSVAVSTGVNETIRVTGKSTTGFTVTSSNSGSTATVDWLVIR